MNNAQVRYANPNTGNNNTQNNSWEWLIDLWNWLISIGFFDSGDWCPELCGQLTNNSATGGPLDALETQLGMSFPDLQAMRQGVVDAWRAWQRSFWDRRAKLEAYREACKQFAVAFDAKKAEHLGGTPPSPIGGVGEWLQKWWPYVLAGGIVVAGVGAIAVTRKK